MHAHFIKVAIQERLGPLGGGVEDQAVAMGRRPCLHLLCHIPKIHGRIIMNL